MPKKMKNMPIEDNPGRASSNIDVLKSENVKNDKTKVVLKKNGEESRDYFLYQSISKY
jgi:hypothetical protein